MEKGESLLNQEQHKFRKILCRYSSDTLGWAEINPSYCHSSMELAFRGWNKEVTQQLSEAGACL